MFTPIAIQGLLKHNDCIHAGPQSRTRFTNNVANSTARFVQADSYIAEASILYSWASSATYLALPVNPSANRSEHYIGFAVKDRLGCNLTSDGSTRRLWYKRLDYSGGQSIWSNLVALPAYGPESIHYGTLRSACGKIPAYWIGPSTGWVHAYPKGDAIILQAVHAATN